jgi:hypothetical protein
MKKSTWRYWVAACVALLAVLGLGTMVNGTLAAAPFKFGASNAGTSLTQNLANGVTVTSSYHNDTSPALRSIPPVANKSETEKEANPNWALTLNHKNVVDTVVQKALAPLAMPGTILNFDGIGFPGVGCNCAPPDTNGEVGATQYVQMVNEGIQVYNKTTGASVLGPIGIATLWAGFGGVCENNGHGDPVVLYDQLANRWLVSQFAGTSVPTDECIAVSTTSDATGAWNRYGFHLGTNYFDYPHLGVWPDAYYMSMNVFNAAGTAFLGPQPFAFDRAKMLLGQPATFVTTGITVGPSEDAYLPADLDGSTLPPAGAPNTFVTFPGTGNYHIYHFHADFTTPANSTFTSFATPAAAGFTVLCPSTRACVPEPNGDHLDAIADRPMFRLAYRNFGDHESLVGNYTVSSSGVAGVRWFELRGVSAGPVTVYQESTYQPDTTWRWLGSVAQDVQGNLAVGFSASSSTVFPSIRYAGRLVSDPLNTLAQGEATLFAGLGSQQATSNRWGDYSDLTVDPVDDCTFWYTSEYYPAGSSQFNWKTRIGNFKFPGCTLGTPTPTVTGTPPTATPTQTSTSTPTATATPCVLLTPVTEGFESGLGSFAAAVATCAPGGCGWTAVTTDKHSGTQSAFAPDRNGLSDQMLALSSSFAVPANATTAVLSFWHRVSLESGFDGGVLEFSTDGGATWSTTDPTFLTGGYNATISTGYSSPIGGRRAWSGTIGSTGSFVNVQVNLLSYAGQANLRFRFREANDTSVAITGWWVDDVSVTITAPCSSGTPTATATTVPPTNTPTATTAPPTNTPPAGSTTTATTVPATATTVPATATAPAATATPVNCPLPFTDVDEFNPFYQYIQCLYCRGIISGYADNTFRWTADVTRGQVSKIIANSAGLHGTVSGQTFTDVPASNPFYVYIERLAATGAISGYNTAANCPSGVPCFRWELPVTRGQLAKIDANAAGYNETPSGQTFRDVPAAQPFYVFIERLSLHGVINGYTCGGPGEPCPGLYYRPNANITRGQVSKVASQTFFPNACAPADR